MTFFSVLIAAPYLLPYVLFMLKNKPGENFALLWFEIEQMDLSIFTMGLGYFGIVFWLGIYGLIKSSQLIFISFLFKVSNHCSLFLDNS